MELTYPPMRAALAHWSPDGRQIAFSGSMPGKPWKIYLISRDGGTAQSITTEEVQETDPTWSKDGSTLAFGHYDLLHHERTFIEMFDTKTGKVSTLPDSQGIFGPRWSPDGRYIAALTQSNNDTIVLYDVAARKWRPLNTGLQTFGYITWAPDSTSLYFDTIATNASAYFRFRVKDSKLEKLADLNKLRRYSDPFGGSSSWTGIAPGDIPLFVRDISTQEIYAFDLQLP
jgi:Tol biopolymer transport system component